MIRGLLVTILISAYGLATIGLPLHFHYCRGQLKHVTMFIRMECHEQEGPVSEHACCDARPMICEIGHANNHCCQDATKWLHENIPAPCAQNPVFKGVNWDLPKPVAFDSDLQIGDSCVPREKHTALLTNGPPLYLTQCAFIFYG